MRIKVNPHSIKIIERNSVNEKEININKCYFEFSEEITNDYVKEAYFTLGENTYKQIIQNNECYIPYEVLEQKGKVEIGVVAFKVEDEETIKRYNPMPTTINTLIGSLKEADNSEPVTPSDKEQMEQMLQDGLEDIQEAIEKAERVDITATKEGKITTIVITKQDGTTQTVHVDDGIGLEFKWRGTELGIRQEGQSQYEYVDLQGPVGPAGAIKMVIVQELPTTGEEGTLYFVPKETPTTQNAYDEYMWLNNDWEYIGEKQIVVDLSDYYKKSETYSRQEVDGKLLLKQPLINNDNKLPYSLISGTPTIPTKTSDLQNDSNFVSNTDYATSNSGGVIRVKPTNGVFLDDNSHGIYPEVANYENYVAKGNWYFISKGTLENVITGKGLVSNTDYASSSTGGVVKVASVYGLSIDSGGNINPIYLNNYSDYPSKANNYFISKGTLETVLANRIGAIDDVLDAINGEVI